MAELSRDEVVEVLGRLSDVIIAEIIATGMTNRMQSAVAACSALAHKAQPEREATMIRQFEIRWSDLGCLPRPTSIVGRLTAKERLPASLMSAPNSSTSVGIKNSPPATPSSEATTPITNPAAMPATIGPSL